MCRDQPNRFNAAAVTENEVCQALTQADRIFAALKPFEQKELMRLLLCKAVVGDREIVLEVRTSGCAVVAHQPQGTKRFGTPEWLPE